MVIGRLSSENGHEADCQPQRLQVGPPQMVELFRKLDRQMLWLTAIVTTELRFGSRNLLQIV